MSRSELFTRESTPGLYADDIRLPFKPSEFEFVTTEIHNVLVVPEEQEKELDFQLFAPTKSAPGISTVQKIRLRSPTRTSGEASFIRPHRDDSYYLAGADKDGFYGNALSGDQIHQLSRSLWPGSAYHWKVMRLPPSAVSKATRAVLADAYPLVLGPSVGPLKRKRPGKKSRIKLRVTLAAARTLNDAKAVATKLKEIAEREKRVRRNREKKLKRKAKAKELKMQVGATASIGGSESESGDQAG